MSELNSLLGIIGRYDMTGEPDLEVKIDKLKLVIESALKLQELVKERKDWYIKDNIECIERQLFGKALHYDSIIEELQSLVKESENA